MSFIHDFGPAKAKPSQEAVKPCPSKVVQFKATLDGQRTLKDGGLSITLGLDETEFLSVAKLLAMRSFVLDVTITPEEAKTYGEKK